MTTLSDKASYLFVHSLVSIKTLNDVVVRAIPEYTRAGNPICHINRHEASHLGWTCNNDYIMILFSSAMSSTVS